ncbi:MAG: class I SAM-dependent methyltransferase, partial [Pelomonas sp.]|nr:class I SAM-dependent methyltransferase [Roseateles sp.]
MSTKPKPPIERQSAYWDRWNLKARDAKKLPVSSVRQGNELVATVAALGRNNLAILDLGCGSGWAGALLRPYGRVTATDMVAQTIERAKERYPDIDFRCGDLFEVPLPAEHFDVVVSLEVLSHVADQPAFFERVANLLKPGGLLLLATQNRRVYARWSTVAPPDPDQLR